MTRPLLPEPFHDNDVRIRVIHLREQHLVAIGRNADRRFTDVVSEIHHARWDNHQFPMPVRRKREELQDEASRRPAAEQV